MDQLNPNLFRFILENFPNGICAVDRQSKIIFWNEGAEKITGHFRQDVLGRICDGKFLQHMDSENNLLIGDTFPVVEAMREGRGRSVHVSLRAKDGHFVSVRLHTAPIRDKSGSIKGAVEIFEEASPTLNHRVNKLASFGCLDMLTGVLNRGMIENRLRENLTSYLKYPVPFCVMCFAVDDLTTVRARFGQAAVDAAVRAAAQAIQDGVRPTDHVGRWNDFELLAILTECNEDEVIGVGERLRKLVHSSGIHWWGDTVHVTVSVGATTVRNGDSVESIIERAEQALRESARVPGKCIVVVNQA